MRRLLPHRRPLCIAPAAMAATLPIPERCTERCPGRCIVLIGLMGAGKTTVGRRLAKRLGLPFVDSDEEIERSADHSIEEIFARFGEPSFRDGERRVLRRLVGGPPKVIATGGGAFMDTETRALILRKAIAVWLRAEVPTLAERATRRGRRPLLRDRDAAKVLEALGATRDPIYAEAPIQVRSDGLSHEQAVEAIVAALVAAGEAGRAAG
jgi:shikimate kinase